MYINSVNNPLKNNINLEQEKKLNFKFDTTMYIAYI